VDECKPLAAGMQQGAPRSTLVERLQASLEADPPAGHYRVLNPLHVTKSTTPVLSPLHCGGFDGFHDTARRNFTRV